MKLYQKYVCVGMIIVYAGFHTIHRFSHPLKVLDVFPTDKEGITVQRLQNISLCKPEYTKTTNYQEQRPQPLGRGENLISRGKSSQLPIPYLLPPLAHILLKLLSFSQTPESWLACDQPLKCRICP